MSGAISIARPDLSCDAKSDRDDKLAPATQIERACRYKSSSLFQQSRQCIPRARARELAISLKADREPRD